MNISLLLSNILNLPVLFFFLGRLAILLKYDLQIPQMPKIFSLYLLLLIGFKGGNELQESEINPEIILTLIGATFMACVVLMYSFFVLKIKLDAYNAEAIAATYGSISAVTFITASSFLTQRAHTLWWTHSSSVSVVEAITPMLKKVWKSVYCF